MTAQDDLMNKPIPATRLYYGGRGGGGKLNPNRLRLALASAAAIAAGLHSEKMAVAVEQDVINKFKSKEPKMATGIHRSTGNSKKGRQIAAATSPLRTAIVPLTKEQQEWNARVEARRAEKKAGKK